MVALWLANSGHWARLVYLVMTVAAMIAGWLVLAALASPFLQIGQSAEVDDNPYAFGECAQ